MSRIPGISIVVPIYNSEQYLKKCIDSILHQTYKDLEIILVNDGSPDSSGIIIEEYGRIDSRIITIHKKNGGAADALNVGTSISSRKYLMYIDADDWIEESLCQKAISLAERNNADIVFWSYYNEYPEKTIPAAKIIKEETVFEGDSLIALRRRMVGLLEHELKDPLKTDAFSSGWGKLYKNELLSKGEEYWVNCNEIGSSDVFFNLQVFRLANRVIYLNENLYHYRRRNPNSLTSNYNGSLFYKFKNLNLRMRDFITANNLGDEFLLALKSRLAMSIINYVVNITNGRSKLKISERLQLIKTCISDPMYRSAVEALKLRHLRFHWQIFFWFVKLRFVPGIYGLGIIMNKLRN